MRTTWFLWALALSLCISSPVFAQMSKSTTLDSPAFSAPGTVLDEPFSLSLSPGTSGGTVRYTLDSSDPSEENGILYTDPLYIDETTVVRAATFMDGTEPSSIETRTYIFPEDVIRQTQENMVAKGWPSYWGGHTVDMGMDPEIVEGREEEVIAALLAVPSFSIVLPFDSLFDEQRGIHPNAQERGRDWERPASIELIYPPDFPAETGPLARHGDREGFAVNAGIRIRGGFSRRITMPKHSFRLYFRGSYGPKNLRYDLFGDEGTDEFDKFDLRTAQTFSWSASGSAHNTMVRDVFSRDTQRDMNVPYTRSRYYHLYLNGQYWGVFQTQERADHWHGELYLGGDKDDYDVIKTNAYNMEVGDGTEDAWRTLYDEANKLAALTTWGKRDSLYMKLQGLNPDGSRNPDYPVLLDADNLIQYMLIIFWTGNTDGPAQVDAKGTKNWFGMRNREGERGFTWFVHDAEHSLFHVPSWGKSHNRTGPFPTGDEFRFSNPQWIHQQLMASNQYRRRFSELAQQHFSDGGALSNEAVLARWDVRVDEVRQIILAESARWGDVKSSPAKTPDDWLRAVTYVRDEFLPTRTPVVIEQLKRTWRYRHGIPGNSLVYAPLYIDASVSVDSDELPGGISLSQNYPNPFNPSTTVTYTLDRSDSVELSVYDLTGRVVSTLVDGIQLAGNHEVRFDAGDLPTGTYLYRLRTGTETQTRTMILVR
ncbi:MAG: T9SS type A sorting domain-containing protein [Bacteroidetes bacterium SB0662_bin_6]|nr:T9SS type A sorting domain-containing protein [Bacteroidetes bacterium SB0668_bin_1]MYE05042.1 T9SS type A sorting domain-containing protein [Bacteroidetes bacterium SB0662_bin_6]